MSRNDPRKQPVADALRAVIENVIETESLTGLVSIADLVVDALADNTPTDIKAFIALLDAVTIAGRQLHEDRDAGRLQLIAKLNSVGDMLRAWSEGKITDTEVSKLMQLDADDDLLEIARQNGITPPGDRR